MNSTQTLFSEKLDHVSIFHSNGIFKVNGGLIGNVKICGMAYPKNVAYAVIKLSAKSHYFNILCTIDVLSCPTILGVLK